MYQTHHQRTERDVHMQPSIPLMLTIKMHVPMSLSMMQTVSEAGPNLDNPHKRAQRPAL